MLINQDNNQHESAEWQHVNLWLRHILHFTQRLVDVEKNQTPRCLTLCKLNILRKSKVNVILLSEEYSGERRARRAE